MSLYMFGGGLISLIVATVCYFLYAWQKKQGVGSIGTIFAWLGAICLGFAIVFRAIVSGRGPFSNMFEYSLAFSFGISMAYNIFERRYKYRSIGLFVLPVAVAILAWTAWAAYTNIIPADVEPLVPALQNNLLLSLHVSVAIVAYGVFAVAFGAAAMYLLQGKEDRYNWLPPANSLEIISYRAAVIGFPFLSLLIILGAFWADQAWGRYWGWDPKET
ncbi:MAG: cytochrome c biogenesis protein CcsA, partial [Dehalococcoidales bacterium]|nr:cytochrome c biogenesis protein CcsA [Dehalococcoidales bacterium]